MPKVCRPIFSVLLVALGLRRILLSKRVDQLARLTLAAAGERDGWLTSVVETPAGDAGRLSELKLRPPKELRVCAGGC